MATDHEHPEVTRRSEYRYLFTAKHHGAGSPTDARWLGIITDDEEFGVFDEADWHEVTDTEGWLFGVFPEDGELRDLGTWSQQVATFPRAREGQPWHGFPQWALNDAAPDNRKGEKMRPEKQVFQKLESVGLITARQRKRLWKGDHA